MKKNSLSRMSKIAIVVGFGVVMYVAAVSVAFADDHGRDGRQEERHGDSGRGGIAIAASLCCAGA